MKSTLRHRQRARDRANKHKAPVRDRYDKLTLAAQWASALLLVATIAVTLWINNGTTADMANALGSMSNIAQSMSNEQQAMLNQAEATENLAAETQTVANATMNQAETSAANAKTAREQLATANHGLSQNVKLFAAQQRPIMITDLMGPHNRVDRIPNAVLWAYDYTNTGVGPAYDVDVDEAISINGGPFQPHPLRIGPRLVPAHGKQWSEAAYVLKPGEEDISIDKPKLRVRFYYSDALGNQYVDTSCVEYSGPGVYRDCSRPDKPKHRR